MKTRANTSFAALSRFFAAGSAAAILAACGGGSSDGGAAERAESKIAAGPPPGLLSDQVGSEDLDFAVSIAGVLTFGTRLASGGWQATIRLLPGQQATVGLTWSTRGVVLATLSRSVTAGTTDQTIVIDDPGSAYAYPDDDSDGFTNLREVSAGTSPSDASDTPIDEQPPGPAALSQLIGGVRFDYRFEGSDLRTIDADFDNSSYFTNRNGTQSLRTVERSRTTVCAVSTLDAMRFVCVSEFMPSASSSSLRIFDFSLNTRDVMDGVFTFCVGASIADEDSLTRCFDELRTNPDGSVLVTVAPASSKAVVATYEATGLRDEQIELADELDEFSR